LAIVALAPGVNDSRLNLFNILGTIWNFERNRSFTYFCHRTLVYSWQKSHLEIVVINNWLYVGNAKIESKYVKKVTVLKKEDFLKIRGPKADPACFNATRFWVTTGVKVEINDKKDPTPYWLISSKKAKALAKSLS
jgi:hypothetical protein